MKKESKIKWDYRNEINKPIHSGTILLSEPFMLDPAFSRSTCLIVNHEKHEGTFGFILNKDSKQKLSELIEIDVDWKVYFGGPVDESYLFFVHNNSFNLKDAIKIKDGLYWNGDFEDLKVKISNGEVKETDIRFFLGYSGWDSGQLRREIIENSWIISNNKDEFIFKNPNSIWNDILKNMGGIYSQFANFPLNPNLN